MNKTDKAEKEARAIIECHKADLLERMKIYGKAEPEMATMCCGNYGEGMMQLTASILLTSMLDMAGNRLPTKRTISEFREIAGMAIDGAVKFATVKEKP